MPASLQVGAETGKAALLRKSTGLSKIPSYSIGPEKKVYRFYKYYKSLSSLNEFNSGREGLFPQQSPLFVLNQ